MNIVQQVINVLRIATYSATIIIGIVYGVYLYRHYEEPVECIKSGLSVMGIGLIINFILYNIVLKF